jgi:large subunit ribosomal protein L30
MAKEIRITQIRSTIDAVPKHKLTIQALGFHRTYQTLVKKDTPQIRGMIQQVRHLVKVEEVK